VAGKSLEELSEVLFLSSLIPLLLTQFMFVSEFVGIVLLGTFIFFAYFSAKRKNHVSKKGTSQA